MSHGSLPPGLPSATHNLFPVTVVGRVSRCCVSHVHNIVRPELLSVCGRHPRIFLCIRAMKHTMVIIFETFRAKENKNKNTTNYPDLPDQEKYVKRIYLGTAEGIRNRCCKRTQNSVDDSGEKSSCSDPPVRGSWLTDRWVLKCSPSGACQHPLEEIKHSSSTPKDSCLPSLQT